MGWEPKVNKDGTVAKPSMAPTKPEIDKGTSKPTLAPTEPVETMKEKGYTKPEIVRRKP